MKKACLLVVDIHTAMMSEHPYNEDAFITNVKKLIELCREKGIEVVYVRHEGKPGGTMEPGSEGWQIYKDIAPLCREKIIDKRFNSAFRQTGLREYLDGIKIETILLVGMQTEFCIDVTCKVAFEYGYDVIIPHLCTTTFDDTSIPAQRLCSFYENEIWDGRYAKVIKLDELESLL